MAKTQKASKKALVANPVIPEIPVKVTIEVIIRRENQLPPSSSLFRLGSEAESGCPDNKFSYSLDRQNASVLSLIVEEFEVDDPTDSGDFTSCINDPNPEPKIRVIGLAKEDNPGGRVALKLKFLGKDVFPTPKEFTLASNGFLKLNVLAKLP